MKFAWPYGPPEGKDAFWGKPTGDVDFCEENYYATSYVAELINTLTNIGYLIYAILGIRYTRSQQRNNYYALPYIGLGLVAIGSGAFHATLKYNMRMADGLSMFIPTAIVLHRVIVFNKSTTFSLTTGGIITAVLVAASIIYYITGNMDFHSACFAVMIVAVGGRTAWLIEKKIHDSEVKRKMRNLSRIGLACSVVGYSVWLIDHWACSGLRSTRRSMGMPWGFILELHGWWHILTGIAAYTFIALIEYLQLHVEGQRSSAQYAWPVSRTLGRDAEKLQLAL